MKKILSVLLALILVSSLFCVTAYAVQEPYDLVELTSGESEDDVKSSITSTSKTMTGVVYSDSTRDVYFRMRYRKNTLTYKTDTALLIAYGNKNNWIKNQRSANAFSTKVYWKFELDNYGVGTKGGHAKGWMW